jgi:hypothetical protein
VSHYEGEQKELCFRQIFEVLLRYPKENLQLTAGKVKLQPGQEGSHIEMTVFDKKLILKRMHNLSSVTKPFGVRTSI